MKKLFFTVALLAATASVAKAQRFDVNSNNITITTGISSGHGIPIAASYEHGVVSFGEDHKLGAGGYIATGGSYTFIAGECNYHFVALKKFDIYGGVRVGYRSLNNISGAHCTVGAGSNYYFAPNWGINMELDSGAIPLSAGVTFSF